ncbi:hypothetical protein [Thermopetrobacter sp. TC1]|nr:hypothetical protein [Thermopetrobacter sp. TC1]
MQKNIQKENEREHRNKKLITKIEEWLDILVIVASVLIALFAWLWVAN